MEATLDRHFRQGTLHHAYLLVGSAVEILPVLRQFLDQAFPKLTNPLASPDVAWFELDRLDKGRAKELRALATNRSFGPAGRFIIVSFPALVDEAQELLLKTFEEPPAGVHFFLVVPSVDFLRPTLLSRLARLNWETLVSGQEVELTEAELLAEKFLALDPSLRIEWLNKNLLAGEEPDRARIFTWLNQIEKYMATRVDFNRISVNLSLVFRELLASKKLLANQRASVKMILDYLALILPISRKNH
ncbi:MAG: hypothetical protein AAB900_00230 [Patescibacteria group bacterium]